MQTHLYKEHHQAVEPQVVDMNMSRVASEVLLLSFLMTSLATSVLVDERYDGALDQRIRDSWR